MGQRVLETDVDAQTVRLEHFRHLVDRIFDHPNLHRQTSTPHVLLLASILKVKQTARGVQLLAEAGCIEDVQALSRTLVEVTVNAAYLQRAGYAELQSFVHFNPQSVYQHVALLGDGRGSATAGVFERLKGMVLQRPPARHQENGDPTWSSKTLLERAAAADAASNIPVMALLMARVYPRGHAALHGTMDSLQPFVAALDRTGRRPQMDRKAAKIEALFAVNLCLFTLCLFLNQNFGLGMDDAIEDAATARHPLSDLRGECNAKREPGAVIRGALAASG